MFRTALFSTLVVVAACGTTDRTDASTHEPVDVVARDAAHDASWNDRASVHRDFTLVARGMSAYEGKALALWLVDSTGYQVIGFGLHGAIAGSDLMFRMPDALPEGAYHVDLFVDGNGNGHYDGLGVDPSWRLTVPYHGSGTVMFSPVEPRTDLNVLAPMHRSDLSIQLTGFQSDEIGHRFELRVIHDVRGTVGAFVHPSLPGPVLELLFPGTVDDTDTYRVDFWVDANGDGVYTDPSSDRTWREMITVHGSRGTLQWTRTEPAGVELNWR